MTEKYPIGIAGPDLNQISREYTALVATHEALRPGACSQLLACLPGCPSRRPNRSLLIIYADIAPARMPSKTSSPALKRAIVIILLPSQLGPVPGCVREAGPGAQDLRPAGCPQGSAGLRPDRDRDRDRPQPRDLARSSHAGGAQPWQRWARG